VGGAQPAALEIPHLYDLQKKLEQLHKVLEMEEQHGRWRDRPLDSGPESPLRLLTRTTIED
jgi:hypothetical protein